MNMNDRDKNNIRCHIPKAENAQRCFEGQKPDEPALLVIRKHWIVIFIIWLKMIFAILIPFAIFFGVMKWNPDLWDISYTRLILVLIHLYALFITLWYFVEWLDQNLDLIIVTNQRVVDINQTRIFTRKQAETSLSQVQDVSGESKGMAAYFFRYGELRILTASAESNVFEMPYVKYASPVASEILSLRDNYLQQMGSQQYLGAVPKRPTPQV